MSEWVVYILRCADGSLYTGITKDLQARMDQHNSGKGAKYTRAHYPCKLVWSAKGFDESAAKKEEYRIKQLTRTKKLALIAAK